MSIATPQLRLPVTPTPAPIRERTLRPLERPQPRRRPKLAFAIIALAGAALIGIAQMALSIATTQDSFVVAELTQQQRELTWQAQAIEESIAGASSPQVLASNADSLGMVVGGSPSYLRLSDGALIGMGTAAGWNSTVNPNGWSAVPNALVSDTPPVAEATAPTGDVQPVVEEPVLPPVAQGLPSPTTR